MVHHIWDDFPDIQTGLGEVRQILRKELSSLPPDIKAKLLSYIDAPGKYFRAGLCLMLDQSVHGHLSKKKYYLAAAIEALHLATLIHDDVIDEADSRRGIESIHRTYSNRIAIYAGDYLLAYASRLAYQGLSAFKEEDNSPSFLRERLMERILAGELAQLTNRFNPQMTFKDYLKQIRGKTALLFALACQVGAWSPETSLKNLRLAFNMGQAIGMAFQLTDDLLDYDLPASQTGKPQFQDIQNGIYTAPFFFARLQEPRLAQLVSNQEKEQWSKESLAELTSLIEKTGAREQTEGLIKKYMERAISSLEHMEGQGDKRPVLSILETVMGRNF